MIDKIVTILKADNTVNTSSGGNIFEDDQPQTLTPPFIVIDVIEGTVNDTKDGASQLDQERISVTCYGKRVTTNGGTIGARSLSDDVRDALDHYEGTVSGTDLFIRADNTGQSYDISRPDKKLKAYELEYEVYVKR